MCVSVCAGRKTNGAGWLHGYSHFPSVLLAMFATPNYIISERINLHPLMRADWPSIRDYVNFTPINYHLVGIALQTSHYLEMAYDNCYPRALSVFSEICNERRRKNH